MTSIGQDDGEAESRRARMIPLWQGGIMALGAVVAIGGLVWEVANGYGKLNSPPREVIAVIIGGIVVTLLPFLIRVPAMIRFWRNAGPPDPSIWEPDEHAPDDPKG